MFLACLIALQAGQVLSASIGARTLGRAAFLHAASKDDPTNDVVRTAANLTAGATSDAATTGRTGLTSVSPSTAPPAFANLPQPDQTEIFEWSQILDAEKGVQAWTPKDWKPPAGSWDRTGLGDGDVGKIVVDKFRRNDENYFLGNLVDLVCLVNLRSMPERFERSWQNFANTFDNPTFYRISYRPAWWQVRDWVSGPTNDLQTDEPLKRLGLKHSTWNYARSTVGNNRGHQKAIQMAREKGAKSVLILEDDFQLNPTYTFAKFKANLTDAYDYLNKNYPRWEILMLGYVSSTGPGLQRRKTAMESVQGISEAYGAQAYIVHQRAYDKILEDTSKPYRKPFDNYYLQMQRHGEVYALQPWAIGQISGWSVIESRDRSNGTRIEYDD